MRDDAAGHFGEAIAPAPSVETIEASPMQSRATRASWGQMGSSGFGRTLRPPTPCVPHRLSNDGDVGSLCELVNKVTPGTKRQRFGDTYDGELSLGDA